MVSGGKGKSGFDEATVMAHYLADNAVPANSIIKDSEGINTKETAGNTAALIRKRNFKNVLIITQYYHIARTQFAFKRAGITSLSADYPRYFEWGDLLAILREAIALPVYFIKMPYE